MIFLGITKMGVWVTYMMGTEGGLYFEREGRQHDMEE